jgi:transaldolase
MATNVALLADYGQSVWYDNLHRGLIDSGGLSDLISGHGVRGVTSNPTIFEKAILASDAYDEQLAQLGGTSPEEAYWELVLRDIREAADALAGVYEATEGADGFVSVEVAPSLAHDADGTVQQAHHLWERLGRANAMIKVPATTAGVQAVEALTFAGINVNVTLIFAVDRYKEVLAAHARGLTQRVAAGLPTDSVQSVASFFISRLDTDIDPLLPVDHPSRGQCAVANARIAYSAFREFSDGDVWQRLKDATNPPLQRPLWASTSTKNPEYSSTLYVDELIGQNTVNTLAPETLEAFEDHGSPRRDTVEERLDDAYRCLEALPEVGIDLDDVTRRLEAGGVRSFSASFDACVAGIAKRLG